MTRQVPRRSVPGFTGQLITPEDDQYDQARQVWNTAVARRPVDDQELKCRDLSAPHMRGAPSFCRGTM